MRGRRAVIGAALALACAPAAGAQECRLALSLGLDVSNSVDAREYALQTRGLAAALEAPEVAAAFLAAPGRFVALQVFEWSGRRRQAVRIDWTAVRSRGDLARVAARLRGQRRSFAAYPTAIGRALAFGAAEIARAPACARATLDLSGDGENNDAEPPEEVTATGITVNGLAIGGPAIADYYAEKVARGPGAFVETARDHADFGRAMRRKLLRELTEAQLAGCGEALRWRRGG